MGLVLQRLPGQVIELYYPRPDGSEGVIYVTTAQTNRDFTRLHIVAPDEVQIMRGELTRAIEANGGTRQRNPGRVRGCAHEGDRPEPDTEPTGDLHEFGSGIEV